MADHKESLSQASEFIETQANYLLTQLGYGGQPAVRFGDQWAWNPESQEVMVDVAAFGDETYKPEWKALAFAHEIEAHHAPARREPASSEWDQNWGAEHPGGHFFLNILGDMAGNRSIIAKVPDSSEGWKDFYANKLFPTSDYRVKEDGTPRPRHVQFLYAMIRETFVPDEACDVMPEVREELNALHDFKGSGQDLLSYATQPFETSTKYLTRMKQMQLWRRGIWPSYVTLYEHDAEDPALQQSGSGQGSGQTSQADTSQGNGQFAGEYKDYEDNHHPGQNHEDNKPTDSQAQTVINAILDRNPETATPGQATEETSPDDSQPPKQPSVARGSERARTQAIQAAHAEAAGVSFEDYQSYQRELQAVLPVIQELRSVFEQFINERVTTKRQLLHRHVDGPVLDPDHLAQTIAQLKSNQVNDEDIPAFLEYGSKTAEREMSGKLDFWLVVDNSPSMGGTKARMAARSAIAVLEGLDMFNEFIKDESRQQGFELDYDARTGVIVFNSGFSVPKPLSLSLTTKERVAATKNIQNTSGGTDTTPALQYIDGYYQKEPAIDRKKAVIVLSDGEDPNAAGLATAITNLRRKGVLVYPIYLQSKVVDSKGIRIDNVNDLPNAFAERVKDSLT